MDTLQYVRACLDTTTKTNKEIAEGAGVGESWVKMFKRGHIPDPGYSRVKLLADYFLRTGAIPVLQEQPNHQEAR
jgi:predicted transcriptional regulator